MGWIIFVGYLFCGVMYHIFYQIEKSSTKGSKEQKIATIVMYCFAGLIGLGLIILAMYAIGWIWYFFCGGFLIFEDQPFWDKVVYGLMSLVFLGFIFGFIAVCCGWDPDSRR